MNLVQIIKWWQSIFYTGLPLRESKIFKFFQILIKIEELAARQNFFEKALQANEFVNFNNF